MGTAKVPIAAVMSEVEFWAEKMVQQKGQHGGGLHLDTSATQDRQYITPVWFM